MADIVLVHGIDQQQKSADLLEKDWLPALAGGVRLAGFPDIADSIWRNQVGPGSIDTRMAFYGNLFLKSGEQGVSSGDLTIEQQKVADDLALEWLQRVAVRASNPKDLSTAKREVGIALGLHGQEQGFGGVQRNIVKRLAKIRWFAPMGMGFAENFINQSLAQVTLYLTDDRIRTEALSTIDRLIDADTKVVIAHSLGSVVAYEAMQKLKHELPLLVTLGSPLGLDTIVYPRLRPQPPCFPSKVKRWVNIADRDDFIAAEPDLTHLFRAAMPSEAIFEGGYSVDNGSEPHSSNFYLSKIEIGKVLGEVFTIQQ